MRVGILSAINPLESKVNWDGSPIDAYIRFFKDADAPFDFAGYEAALGELPDSPDACDFYVITGSPQGVYDSDPWIEPLMRFIREGFDHGKKFVGICFGHQVLAEALGGQVRKSEKGWGLGMNHIELQTSREWMTESVDQCSLYFAHQDQVEVLPPGAELLGGSRFCPIGMYEINGRILGIQGHPEFTESIMNSIIEQSKNGDDLSRAKAAESAVLANNGQGPDNQMIARWIINFLSADL